MDMDIGHYLNYNFHYWICYSQIHNTKAYSGWNNQTCTKHTTCIKNAICCIRIADGLRAFDRLPFPGTRNLYWFIFLKWNSFQNATKAFFCECIWDKPSCKIIITTKEALLRFTVFSQCKGHFYDGNKTSIFKTLRRRDTTRNCS